MEEGYDVVTRSRWRADPEPTDGTAAGWFLAGLAADIAVGFVVAWVAGVLDRTGDDLAWQVLALLLWAWTLAVPIVLLGMLTRRRTRWFAGGALLAHPVVWWLVLASLVPGG